MVHRLESGPLNTQPGPSFYFSCHKCGWCSVLASTHADAVYYGHHHREAKLAAARERQA